MGNTIDKEQNEDKNIKFLTAQRALYSRAKILFGLQLILSGPVVIVLGLYSIYYSGFMPITNLYTVFLSFLEILFFSRIINKYKKMGATVQEEFDCGILRIYWNDIIAQEKLSSEKVNEWSKKVSEKERGFVTNWYKDFPEIFPYSAARIVIQKYNTNWDNDLRSSFSVFITMISCFIAIVILLVFSVENLSFNDFYQIMLPVLPITILLVLFYGENKSAMRNLDAVRNKLDEVWGDLSRSRKTEEELMTVSRNIQNAIYLHREISPLIFDWYYKWKSERQQDNADYSVARLAKDYSDFQGDFPVD